MATFPSIDISYGAQKRSRPNTRTVKFGDGYEHRTVFGLPGHANPKEWTVTWNNITNTEADTIETFLNARAEDSASFDWSPPDTNSTYKWVCSEWTRTIDYPTVATINATFREVFEP